MSIRTNTQRISIRKHAAPATLETIQKALGGTETAIQQFRTKVDGDLTVQKGVLEALGIRLDKIEARNNRQGEGNAAPSIMKAITEAPGFVAMRNGATSSGRIQLPGNFQSIRKALLSTQAGGSPNQGFDVLPQRYAGIGEDPRRKLTLLDALPHLPVISNVFEWNQLDGYVDAAADQGAESMVKAEAQVPLTLSRAPIVTVAHFLKASRQVLDDVPMLQNYVDGLLGYGVSLKLERLITAGNVAGSIQGLLGQATVFMPTALKAADQISEAQAALAAVGWDAGLAILHPIDWHKIRTERSTTAYFAGGWDEPAAPNIWGLPVVRTPSLTQGTAIVMAPAAVAILDRQAVSVLLGYDGNDFSSNMVTILAEGRFGFAVISNGAVYKLQLTF